MFITRIYLIKNELWEIDYNNGRCYRSDYKKENYLI